MTVYYSPDSSPRIVPIVSCLTLPPIATKLPNIFIPQLMYLSIHQCKMYTLCMTHENFDNSDHFITPPDRQAYLVRLKEYLERVMPAGAVSDETEAERLFRMLLENEPVKKSYVEKIIGQLGNEEDRGSLYH